MIVHYYGGCSPTSRRFGGGSHYPAHYWNALGYIVLIVNPSGASGFGQEWASRHVNTMGEGPAQDIIDATRQFARDVAQVDSTKIGCVSASYGGFMTQYAHQGQPLCLRNFARRNFGPHQLLGRRLLGILVQRGFSRQQLSVDPKRPLR